MAHGIVTRFDVEKGFGFISRSGFVSRDHGGADVFVHCSEIDGSRRGIGRGTRVTFTLESRAEGLRATNVRTA